MKPGAALAAFGLGAAVLAPGQPPLVAEAQQAGKVYRVGYLGTFPPTGGTIHVEEAFLGGLRERGWMEGRNIVIERRFSEGKSERFAEFAAEFVRSKVALILATGTPATRAARQATDTIPIVTVLGGDPVGSGLVASLAHPGGNVTGVSSQSVDLTAKQLDLLRAVVPTASRIAVMWNPQNQAHLVAMREVETAARSLQIRIQALEVRTVADLEPRFVAITREQPAALWVLDDTVTAAQRQQIADFAMRHRLPSMYLWRFYLEAGGLMSYGPSLPDLFRRASFYVDRILKGARPGDLPVEQPTKFVLIINRKTATTLGVTIPEALLLQADEVMD
jgi:putative ABC transport system substrate-binding protein